MTGAAFDQARRPRGRKYAVAGIWLAALLITLHPVTENSLWWELSRGRAVVAGSWHPTADLIAGSTGNDADWLGGVIPYALFEMFGVSGLMGLKIIGGLLLTRLLLQRIATSNPGNSWATTGIALLATLLTMRSAGEPVPVLFDVIGFTAVFLAIERWDDVPSGWQFARVLLLLAWWANFGPRVIVGLLACVVTIWQTPTNMARRAGRIAAAFIVASLTPAGVMTLRNSLIQTWPAIAEGVVYLQAAGWHPWWTDLSAAESIAFLLLSGISLLAACERPSWRRLVAFVAAHFLACCSAENLPLAAVGLMLMMTLSPGLHAVTADKQQSPPRRTPGPQRSAEQAMMLDESPRWHAAVYAAVWLWVCWTATHPWSGCESGLGWGLDPQLHPDAFAASVAGTTVKGNAHCVGVREAGLLSWHLLNSAQPFDTPVSALLNSRLKEHVLLTSDLSRRWQTPHRRPDGAWGGWWQTTRERGITLLVVPGEDLELITALEPTVWKPCSLDAVSLVYGVAGDPDVTQQIVKTLSLRQFVDRGAWTYQTASVSGSSPIEFFAWPDHSAAANQSLRLARVFRAMEMHYAALKVLHGVPGNDHHAVREEFFANQLAMGYRDRVIAGRSSEFRLRTSLLVSRLSASDIRERLNWPRDARLSDDDSLAAAVFHYVAGDLSRAITGLQEDSAQVRLAKAQLLLEAGDPGQAQGLLRTLIADEPTGPVVILARNLSSTLGE
ncbi:MAG TPA: hypothetical protein VFG20_07980 [Planctomycetaceae bacterium]|nr:hypothetical protein [Planctomycetaceae bacterium]